MFLGTDAQALERNRLSAPSAAHDPELIVELHAEARAEDVAAQVLDPLTERGDVGPAGRFTLRSKRLVEQLPGGRAPLVSVAVPLGQGSGCDRDVQTLREPILSVVAEARLDLEELVLRRPQLRVGRRECFLCVRHLRADLLGTLALKLVERAPQFILESQLHALGLLPAAVKVLVGQLRPVGGERRVEPLDRFGRQPELHRQLASRRPHVGNLDACRLGLSLRGAERLFRISQNTIGLVGCGPDAILTIGDRRIRGPLCTVLLDARAKRDKLRLEGLGRELLKMVFEDPALFRSFLLGLSAYPTEPFCVRDVNRPDAPTELGERRFFRPEFRHGRIADGTTRHAQHEHPRDREGL